MKYIRTKDSVYEVNSYIEQNGKIVEFQSVKYIDKNDKTTTISMKKFYKEEILKEADTIEELCDGFYNDILNDFDCFGFDRLYIYNDFESFKSDWIGYRIHDNWQGNGYGFIKTDKRLIYVAKMNEKGELELIWN